VRVEHGGVDRNAIAERGAQGGDDVTHVASSDVRSAAMRRASFRPLAGLSAFHPRDRLRLPPARRPSRPDQCCACAGRSRSSRAPRASPSRSAADQRH
jgi:hypothetical protein